MLHFTHMRSRTAPLAYLKFCAHWIGYFSWATHDWSRGWISYQGDGVKTRRPRHLRRSCPLNDNSKICQLSVLSTWLIAWVLLAQRMPILLLWCEILVDKHFTLFNPGIQRCPSESGILRSRGRDLNLEGNVSWMFWIPIFFKIQAGVFLGFATLEKYTYRSILMIGHRRFAVVQQTMYFIYVLFTLTACTVSHLWIRLVPSPTTAQPESE